MMKHRSMKTQHQRTRTQDQRISRSHPSTFDPEEGGRVSRQEMFESFRQDSRVSTAESEVGRASTAESQEEGGRNSRQELFESFKPDSRASTAESEEGPDRSYW
jgi:hypothetical protein